MMECNLTKTMIYITNLAKKYDIEININFDMSGLSDGTICLKLIKKDTNLIKIINLTDLLFADDDTFNEILNIAIQEIITQNKNVEDLK